MTPSPTHALGLVGLLRLRVAAVVGILALVLLGQFGLGLTLPLPALLGVLASWIAITLATGAWLARSGDHVGPAALTLAMALDALLLTVVFGLTGGPSNPFSFLYLVHLALASVVLPRWHAWALGALGALLFGALFVLPLPPLGGEHAGHGGGHDMTLHLRGMWVAFVLAGALILGVVSRVSDALRDREQALAEARAAAARTERLASLATFAAGAAHELSTPLSTIAVVAGELELELANHADLTDVRSDVTLIRQQVARCRAVLDALRADAGDPTGEAPAAVAPATLVANAAEGLDGADRVIVETDGSLVATYPRSLALALRNLLKNALDASPADGTVVVAIHRDGHGTRLAVRDRGTGMSTDLLARVGEPFFTTRANGRGMGLGVFLSRAIAERLGGRLELSSTTGVGTSATLHIPSASLP